MSDFVTITGTDFVTGTKIRFGSLYATNIIIISGTELTCLPPYQLPGVVDVTIENPDGATFTLAASFTYVAEEIYKPDQEFTIKINNFEVSANSEKKFTETQELNIIDNYDYAFDGVDVTVPMEFIEHFTGGDELAVFKYGKKIYKGYVSGQKFMYKNNKTEIHSLPQTDYLNKYAALFNTGSLNPALHLTDIFNTYLPIEYTVGNIIAQSNKLAGISIAINSNVETENIKSLINKICESFDIGVYTRGLEIRAFAVPALWPNTGTEITEYLLERPEIEEKTDKFYNKVTLEYSTAFGVSVATVTSGTGPLLYEFSLNGLFCTAAVAALIAARKLDILNRYYYYFTASVSKNFILEMGQYFSYAGIIFVITTKEKEGILYKIKGIGVKK